MVHINTNAAGMGVVVVIISGIRCAFRQKKQLPGRYRYPLVINLIDLLPLRHVFNRQPLGTVLKAKGTISPGRFHNAGRTQVWLIDSDHSWQ